MPKTASLCRRDRTGEVGCGRNRPTALRYRSATRGDSEVVLHVNR
ncbi:hypothetical protein ACH47C_31485 [Streptomyces rishiriensis]